MNANIVLGIDIGGSHITAALVDMTRRSIIQDSYKRQHINSRGNREEIINSWCAVIGDAFRGTSSKEEKKIGIGMPGPFDYSTGISYIQNTEKYDALYGVNVKKLLAERLGIYVNDIRMMNDAACFLQGEVFGGAAQGCKTAIGITLGTGLGTSYYCDGVAKDVNLWKMPFKESIAEDYISTRWFLKMYRALSGNTVNNVKELTALHNTDSTVREIFSEFAHNLAQFISLFVNDTNPEIIVLGGNIANAHALFFHYLNIYLKTNKINIPVKRAQLNEEAAIVGAASCFEI
ncbi:hypothetical protein GCM10023149_16800 [Mucilaginibacter gynuensis]|uniref:Glucokinase n=1 Tax=Mucilaginibacter gynuensis TaxID=1302236 RepID=A0ABP8G6U0_9SPHI